MKDHQAFEDYLFSVITTSDKLYYNYMGINRKEFPKWPGWKVIRTYKDEGITIKEIQDAKLDTLVRNFHYLRYISHKFK